MTVWPVFIPSKGRAGTIRVPAGVDVTVVVEPHEYALYRQALPEQVAVVELPSSGQGIAYARQWIKTRAETFTSGWFWMLDDDIRGYYFARGSKCHPAAAKDVLIEAQTVTDRWGELGQIALEYQQFAWASKKEFTFNSYCDVAVAIHVERTESCHYRSCVDMKEDRDMTLQILASGRWTARTSRCAFGAPSNGSNAGGLMDEYGQDGRELEASMRLVRMWSGWPGLVRVHQKPNGRQDAKINWRQFALRQADIDFADKSSTKTHE